MTSTREVTLEEFFLGFEESRPLLEALRRALDLVGPSDMRVTKSQVAFRRRKAFAWTWVPARYLRGKSAPLVLTLAFPHRDPSPRWKQIVEPRPGTFIHHLELHSAADLDDEVIRWLRGAWTFAG
jgi:hypothetical protein